jgi:hypothetical protein
MRLAIVLALLAGLLCAAPAAAVDRYIPMKAPPAPGPSKYDKVFVQQLGPRKARNVLVLVPGTNGGAGGITPVARDIARRVPSTQVWVVDRREQAFEDTAAFAQRDPDAALDHYLGFKYRSVKGADAKFVADWGLRVQLTGPPQRRAQGGEGRTAGPPRRALRGCLDGRRLRRLGLRGPGRLAGPRRARADRRRPAGQLQRGEPRAGAA